MKEDRPVAEAIKQANELFTAMGQAVEASVKEGVEELDVLDVARRVGLKDLDEQILDEMQLPRLIPIHPWLPWHIWWPWRPLWCWWWRRYYPWYGWCCPWWWHRCRWYPL